MSSNGSHIILRHADHLTDASSVPNHKELKGTLRALIREAGLTWTSSRNFFRMVGTSAACELGFEPHRLLQPPVAIADYFTLCGSMRDKRYRYLRAAFTVE